MGVMAEISKDIKELSQTVNDHYTETSVSLATVKTKLEILLVQKDKPAITKGQITLAVAAITGLTSIIASIASKYLPALTN